jgi:TRAP-type mannitol/chloroaromatic compound transport system permease small subunit
MRAATQALDYFVFGQGLYVVIFLLAFFALASVIGFIRFADGIKWLLEKIAFACGWFLIVLMFVTCMDITFRKLQLPIALTQFQELEWHLHTIVFSAWMGYNYTINAHPRVDSYTETLGFRGKAWIEFWGILLLALPFLITMLHHGLPFVTTSYLQNEASENVTGLPYRWLIKSIFYAGIWLVMLGVLSVLLRLMIVLFRRKDQAETGLQIGHSELEV